jgi:hypothetical protein
LGALIGLAAGVSTAASGFMFHLLGRQIGFLVLAGIAASAAMTCWAFLPETKPEKYLD